MSDKKVPKFIIDTDAGVDDAAALLMAMDAHKRKEIQVLGITTVFGNTTVDNVIKNVCRILDVAKCNNIPVYRGASEGMVVKYERVNYFHGIDGFNDVHFDSEADISRVKDEKAVDAIRRLIHEHPGEITLVTLGPLTNVAIAFKIDSSLSACLNELVIMGGNTEGVGNCVKMAEFNFHADPEAAYTVLDCVKCITYVVGWELCFLYTKIEQDWCINVLGNIDTPEAQLMNKIEEPWFKRFRQYPVSHSALCDQLAMLIALDKSAITQSSRQAASVELAGSQTRGQMVLDRRRYVIYTDEFKPNVITVERADIQLFKKYLKRALGHPNVKIH